MRNAKRPKITIKDLARLCDVSIGTIDRAIHNKPGVSKATRDRVMQMAEQHGYKPDRIAQSLQSGKTYEIGLVVHDLNNRFFSLLVDAIQQVAWEHNYYIQLAISLRDTKREYEIIEHMLQRNVDGILLFATNTGQEFYRYLMDIDKPVVLLANRVHGPKGAPEIPFVGLDNCKAIEKALMGIIAKGYRAINFVSPFFDRSYKHNYWEIDQRFRTFSRFVEKRGIEHHAFITEMYLKEIAEMKLEKRTAFFCASDIFALELIKLFQDLGRDIPQDVGVMGFDNIDVLKYVRPGLSTIKYPVDQLGTSGFLLLDDLMANKQSIKEVILDAEIIWRDSI
ncbi:LacI family DNA-binding transcriptional regulator [Pleomorphochaeta sp. DL1XJH-081]|uniref:LacI family DNA-binding transcriptional regulator n=1 Tax=Pleomorphochaeta sp. DL1XJH-081 TaxID=3409690 RepID=UPI003BB4DB6C